jgi:hypothetical protein
LGLRDRRRRTIWINVQAHASDREVRSTVLHEMAHAATKSRGHDIRFFAQVEKLLQRGAPIGVGAPEAGRAQILKDIVPARFPLLKRRMERAEAQRSRELERWVERKKIPSEELTDDGIIREFEDAASDGLSWKKALLAIGPMYGLTDESGRPTHRLARCLLATARKAHARARRDTLRMPRAENRTKASDEAGA